MSQKFAAVKGMNDLLPGSIELWQRLETVAREVFGTYGFSEIRTPAVEDTALFVRSVGEGTDIVGKEMYTFEDKGGRSITLRPEGTAPAARAYIEHGFTNTEPLTRWFYMGPMFRYERMKTGRYRQFYQLGCEAYGTVDPSQDVEVIALAMQYLKKIGIEGVSLNLNSLGDAGVRQAYGEKVRAYFQQHESVLSEDAKKTLQNNPMRLLDSKEEALQPLIAAAPVILDSLDEPSRAHFEKVQSLLTALQIPFVINPRLVRGLDYYTRTAFEFIASDPVLGTASAVGGGGRYDRLIHELGGPEKPAVGFAMGMDRLVLLLQARGAQPVQRPLLFVATGDGPSRDAAVQWVMKLRNEGLRVDFDPRGGKFAKQMERAFKVKAHFFGMFGDKELETQRIELKSFDLPKDAPGNKHEVALSEIPQWLRVNATGVAPVGAGNA